MRLEGKVALISGGARNIGGASPYGAAAFEMSRLNTPGSSTARTFPTWNADRSWTWNPGGRASISCIVRVSASWVGAGHGRVR